MIKLPYDPESLRLPRGYVSWSMLQSFTEDRNQFDQRYLLGKETWETQYIRLGKHLANMMQGIEEPANAEEFAVAEQLTKLDLSEVPIEVDIDGLKLFGVFDAASSDLSKIVEYKSGLVPWDEDRAQMHGQNHMYALMTYLFTGGKTVPEVRLEWAPTWEYGTQLGFTGDVYGWDIHIDEFVLEDTAHWIAEVAWKVSQATKAFHGEYDGFLDLELFREYAAVKAAMKDLSDQEKVLKEKIEKELQLAGLDRLRMPDGLFYFQDTSRWEFSEAVKTLQEDEKISGAATQKTSTSLRFRAS